MNKCVLCGRLTRDPDINYSNKDNEALCIARYTLAVDRKGKKDETDYISCKAFGKAGEFVEKYLKKGTKILVSGRIQTGSYEKDGRTIYTTDVIVEEHEFVEPKRSEEVPDAAPEGFVNVTEETKNDLPFKK